MGNSAKMKNSHKKKMLKDKTQKKKLKKKELIHKKRNNQNPHFKIKTGLRNKDKTFRERLKEQLKASRFRYFNEQFYLSSSTEAKNYFSEHPEEFKAYHDGYKQQASLWPKNPINDIIHELQRRLNSGKSETIADFGCGQAKLAQILAGTKAKVFSFDLVAVNDYVTACDMAETKLFNNSVDVAVFCLSLMGSNISKFIKEANRVLKENGVMKIVEVKSRFENAEEFIKTIEQFGFSLLYKNLSDAVFYYFDFKKRTSISKNKKKKLPEIQLKPCLYKHR